LAKLLRAGELAAVCAGRTPRGLFVGRAAAVEMLEIVLHFSLMAIRGHRLTGLGLEGEAQHGPFCRLGVSVKETSVCIVDDTGEIVREVKVASEPDALLAVRSRPGSRRRGLKKAIVALARRPAAIMHRSGSTAPSADGQAQPHESHDGGR
jgi:hypothetical protein